MTEQEEQRDIPPMTWFQCPVCRSLTGGAAPGLPVLALKNVAQLI